MFPRTGVYLPVPAQFVTPPPELPVTVSSRNCHFAPRRATQVTQHHAQRAAVERQRRLEKSRSLMEGGCTPRRVAAALRGGRPPRERDGESEDQAREGGGEAASQARARS